MGYFHASKLLTLAFLWNKEIHAQRIPKIQSLVFNIVKPKTIR